METFIADWLNLILRWAHMIVGIGWIGTSFYFIALDLSLKKRDQMNAGVMGTAWQVHGGGFYNIEKYLVAPATLPTDLKWFQWDAYLTWVTGFALLIVQYYFNANAYLIDKSVYPWLPSEAIAISIITLLTGWLVYDRLCRTRIGENTGLLALLLFLGIVGASFMLTSIFSGRGALIHIGALIGTIMAFNVFRVIIPNQKKITASLLAGQPPDPNLGMVSKQRSIHNNYLTLPVLLLMVSNHYPLLTNHPQSWILVALVLVMGACVRHFINRHDAHDPLQKFVWTLPVAGLALLVALVMTAPRSTAHLDGINVSEAEILQITQVHCATCHADAPTSDLFDEAPKGVQLQTIAQMRQYKDLVLAQAVHSDAMPLGNESDMTQEERDKLGAWLLAQR